MRQNVTVASVTDAFKTRGMKYPRCVSFCELYLAVWVGFDAIKLKYNPDKWD